MNDFYIHMHCIRNILDKHELLYYIPSPTDFFITWTVGEESPILSPGVQLLWHVEPPTLLIMHRSPVKEWQVSKFVLGTISLSGTDTTVKRLDRNAKTLSTDSLAIFANNGRYLCHSKLLSPRQTS